MYKTQPRSGLNIGSPVCSAACGTECGGGNDGHATKNPEAIGLLDALRVFERVGVDFILELFCIHSL